MSVVKLYLIKGANGRDQIVVYTYTINNDKNDIYIYSNHLSYFLSPVTDAIGPMYPLMFGYGPRWFCSELVVCGLRVGGVLDVCACRSSPHPQCLFRVLESASTPCSVRGACVLDF